MKDSKTKMSETMRKAIYSVINPDDKEGCIKVLRDAVEEFISAYYCDKPHNQLVFNACLANILMDILMENKKEVSE